MNDQTQAQVLKSLDSISQNAHMLTGASWTFLFIVLHHPGWLWYAIPFYITVTAWKEFWYDDRFEIPEIRGSSPKDFLFYNIGWVGALVIYFLSTKI